MIYYIPYPDNVDELKNVPPEDLTSGSKRAFPNTAEAIEAMSIWLSDYVVYGEMINNGEASIYQFSGPKPTPLPINLTLNYVQMSGAERLDDNTYEQCLEWLSRFNSDYLINSQYETGGHNYNWHKDEFPDSTGFYKLKGATGREIVKILSDVVKSTGNLVWNPHDAHPEMKYQVIPTINFNLTRVDNERAYEIGLSPEDDRGEFGLGGNWWAEEQIMRIARDLI